MNIHRNSLGLLLATAFGAAGCDCSDVVLEIVEPADGAVFNTADDVNGDADGVQIIVLVATEDLSLGDPVDLTLDSVDAGSADVGTGGIARFEITLSGDGEHTIVARAEGASSAPVIVVLDTEAVPECPGLSILAPEDGVTLRGEDDQDDEPCGEFVFDVIASTDAQTGRSATLLVNGNSVAEAEVASGSITFAAATLDAGNNELEVVFDLDEDNECRSEPIAVTVDCGVTCTIVEPTGDTLSQEDDVGDDPGLQVDFRVTTDAEDGQEVVLSIDGGATDLAASVAGGEASFPETSLAEGEREVQAICADAAGNEARSARVRFDVDTVAPGIDITEPDDGALLGLSADADEGAEGLQVQVCASTGGEGEVCAYIAGSDPGPDGCDDTNDGSACVLVDCNGDVNVEASISDDAGNISVDSIELHCDAGIPVIQLQDPLDDAVLNATNDLDSNVDGLQYSVVVCSDAVGETASLYANDALAGTAEVMDAECDGPGLAEPVDGTAIFSVTIPEGDGRLRAEVEDAGANRGVSPVVDVTVDSYPPSVLWLRPVCGTVLAPSDDEDGDPDNGIQYDVQVRLNEAPLGGTLTLDVSDGLGGEQSIEDPTVLSPYLADFPDVTFRDGMNTLSLDIEDEAGNLVTRTCDVTANEGGEIRITSPAGNAVYTSSGDGDTGTPGYQGASVTIVSDGPTDGTMQVCVDPMDTCVVYDNEAGVTIPVTLPEGDAVTDQVALTARTVGFPGDELGSSPVTIRVDTLPPTTPTNLAVVVDDARDGAVHLTFEAPEDPTGRRVTSYRVRLSLTPFASEDDGTQVNAAGAVVDPGSEQRLDVTGISPGAQYYFTVRGRDAVGNRGTSATAVTATLSFDAQTIESPNTAQGFGFGYIVAGGADVNGDEFDDVVVGTVNPSNRAYIFYGGVDGLASAPDVTISAPGGSAFGTGVTILQDFNGDEIGDVAVGDYGAGGFNGRTYVFFGRDDFLANIDTSNADMTIASTEASDMIGRHVSTAGDVNGDGLSDLLIGAIGYSGFGGAPAFDGEAYLVLGDDTPSANLSLPADAALRITGVINGGKLYNVAPAGDINRDGRDDFIVSTCNTVSTGAAYVFYGETTEDLAADPVRAADEADVVINGGAGDTGFGCAAGGVGDINGDNRGDIVVSSPWITAGGLPRGAFDVYLEDGLGGVLDPIRIENNLNPGPDADWLGFAVAPTLGLEGLAEPSVDPGSTPDLAIGQQKYADTFGRVVFYWGGAGIAAGDVSGAPASASEPAGASALDWMNYAGDVDGDGHIDLVVGDRWGRVNGDPGNNQAGRVYLIR